MIENKSTESVQKLEEITRLLLDPDLIPLRCREAAHSLYELCCKAISFDEMAEDSQRNVETGFGQAIAARWAASCVLDYKRTQKFLMGIRAAIDEKLKQNGGRPVIVLYAGTGPFAALLSPLSTIFSSAELKMILLEINPLSMAYLKNFIEHFNMQEYVLRIEEANAATYLIPPDLKPDIVLSETMQAALRKEPQVSIVTNLVSQCEPETQLIPEIVKVELCLTKALPDSPDSIRPVATLLEVDFNTASLIKKNPGLFPVLSTGIPVSVTKESAELFHHLKYCTTIQVFGDYILEYNESGLTIPITVAELNAVVEFPLRFSISYCMGETPGFQVEK